jgi:hypothetical protein
MSLAFKELAGSPQERFRADGMTAQRRIVVAWEDRHAMVAQLLGEGYALGGAPQTSYPGRPGLMAMDVRLEAWPASPDCQAAFDDVAAQLNSYSGKFALLTIDYELPDVAGTRGDLPPPQPGTYLTYRMELGGEYMTLSGQTMHWQSDGSLPVPPDAVPTLRAPIAEHHLTWHRVAAPPWTAIRHCAGTINQSAFVGAAPETMLFDGATAVKQFLGVNELQQPQFGWKITYVFREKTIKTGYGVFGWNHRYRCVPRDAPGWDRLADVNGQCLYQTSDFAPLFQFEPGA